MTPKTGAGTALQRRDRHDTSSLAVAMPPAEGSQWVPGFVAVAHFLRHQLGNKLERTLATLRPSRGPSLSWAHRRCSCSIRESTASSIHRVSQKSTDGSVKQGIERIFVDYSCKTLVKYECWGYRISPSAVTPKRRPWCDVKG